jgi:hypothetical protein
MKQKEMTILPPCQAFYIDSMLFLTESALRSVGATNHALKPLDTGGDIDHTRVLNSVQNIVVQGAALSRYFWPVRQEYVKRGEILRQAFEVTEESPLKPRDLRNAIEHFDEKLDDYLRNGIVGMIFPHYVGQFLEKGGIPSHFFRAYYTDKAVFEILGKEFAIEPMVKEIARIHKLLEVACNSGGGFPNRTKIDP